MQEMKLLSTTSTQPHKIGKITMSTTIHYKVEVDNQK